MDHEKMASVLRTLAISEFGRFSVGVTKYSEETKLHDLEIPMLYVMCSDQWALACADSEVVPWEDVLIFEKRMTMLHEAHEYKRAADAATAYVAIKRGSDPGAMFKYFTRTDKGYLPIDDDSRNKFNSEKEWWIQNGVKPSAS